jgi:predicted acyl esterase
VKIVVDMWSTAYEMAPGHRLGALVASAQQPAFDAHRNRWDDLASGIAMETTTQTVHHGGTAASRLLLYVLQEPRPPRRHLRAAPG